MNEQLTNLLHAVIQCL